MSSSKPRLAVVSDGPLSDDLELEREIDHQTLLLHTSKDRRIRVAACEQLTKLVAMRSQSRVAEMEREQGIR